MRTSLAKHSVLSLTGIGIGLLIASYTALVANYFDWGPPLFSADITVEDFRSGENVEVGYVRYILADMRGDWTVDVQRLASDGFWSDIVGCQGTGPANYTTDESGSLPLLMHDFAGLPPSNTCFDVPGEYRLSVSWKMGVFGESELRFFWELSNTFTVSAG